MWYVYAYDYWGGVTYFIVSKMPEYARRGNMVHYFAKIAAKKLGVSIGKVYVGKYSKERFAQEHIPTRYYREGKWVSGTWD
jgi:hypothetical protein